MKRKRRKRREEKHILLLRKSKSKKKKREKNKNEDQIYTFAPCFYLLGGLEREGGDIHKEIKHLMDVHMYVRAGKLLTLCLNV